MDRDSLSEKKKSHTVKLGLYVHGLVRTLGYYVRSVDHGHRPTDTFALSLFFG